MAINLERMLAGYVECAAWADCGPDHETYEKEWDEDVVSVMHHDCEVFVSKCGTARLDALAAEAPRYSDERFGHDFWLTRNGHGAGFWDRDELNFVVSADGRYDMGWELTQVAKRMGERTLYLGDDGKVHQL